MRDLVCVSVLVIAGCHSSSHETIDVDAPQHAVDASGSTDAAGASNPLGLSCAVTTSTFAPALCPAPSPGAGSAAFCYRPQWPGVIGVDVLGGFGKTGDWTTPLVSLTAVGNGTWSATVPLSGGPFPYIFEVHGSTDNVISVNQYAIDQTNPSFVPAPAQSPYQRSVSQLTLPQVAAPIYHLTGSVELSGEAQPCFVAEIDVGELDKPDSDEVLSEHGVANFVEIGADGTFDTPVADGPVLVNIKYPFGLSTTYPDPMTTPSLGVTRTTTTIAGADLALDAADFTYVTSAYAAMSPPSGTTAPAPIAFAWNLVAGATGSYMSITATNIAGSDPAYTSGSLGSAISASWDGTFNGGTKAVAGTTYYWGTWQQRDIWISESLEFPITLQ